MYLKFWATWCTTCRAQMPAFKADFARYAKDIDFVAVDIGVDDDRPAVEAYRRELALTMPVAIDEERVGKPVERIKLVPEIEIGKRHVEAAIDLVDCLVPIDLRNDQHVELAQLLGKARFHLALFARHGSIVKPVNQEHRQAHQQHESPQRHRRDRQQKLPLARLPSQDRPLRQASTNPLRCRCFTGIGRHSDRV